LGLGTNSATFTWQSRVEGVVSDTTRQVTSGTTLDFVSQGTPGSVELPPSAVAAERVITLTPPAQSAAPTETAEFMVNLSNPLTSPATFQLSLRGVPQTWVSFEENSVIIPAHESMSVPLRLTPPAFTQAADF